MKCGLLGSEASKGRPLDFGRMSANDAKTVYLMTMNSSLYAAIEDAARAHLL